MCLCVRERERRIEGESERADDEFMENGRNISPNDTPGTVLCVCVCVCVCVLDGDHSTELG